MNKTLKNAQFIELGEHKPFHRCNLKFAEHQSLFKKYNKTLKEVKTSASIHSGIIAISEEMIRLAFMLLENEPVHPIDDIKTLNHLWNVYKKISKINKRKQLPGLLDDIKLLVVQIHCRNLKLEINAN